jgi:hypothetical protein
MKKCVKRYGDTADLENSWYNRNSPLLRCDKDKQVPSFFPTAYFFYNIHMYII